MDWFEKLTGFEELSYAETQRRLSVVDGRLRSTESQRSYGVGRLELAALSELRDRTRCLDRQGRLRLSIIEGDVRAMHSMPSYSGAVFQVASQFNVLEMVHEEVTPEHGVTGYAHDLTQGPACAMAAGAATIYRNYLVPIAGGVGQTKSRQLNGLADLGLELARRLGTSVPDLWRMQNGYALASKSGLAAIIRYLGTADEASLDSLRALLRIGVHWDVEVTDPGRGSPLVTQAFCSALPVAYSDHKGLAWAPFARLVLEAAYEATLLVGLLNAARGQSKHVLLTRLGGGAFGNDDAWIEASLLRACTLLADVDLEVSIVSYRGPVQSLKALVARFNALSSA